MLSTLSCMAHMLRDGFATLASVGAKGPENGVRAQGRQVKKLCRTLKSYGHIEFEILTK